MAYRRVTMLVFVLVMVASQFAAKPQAEQEKPFIFVSRIAQLSTCNCHNVLLEKDGTAWAWGYNEQGQLGLGTETEMEKPTKIPSLANVIEISAGGSHSLALKKDGTVWGWGANDYGELGDGTRRRCSTPKKVEGLSDVKAIAAGCGFSLAVKKDGTVWRWGRHAYACDSAEKDNETMFRPQLYTKLSDVKAIAANDSIVACIKSDGSVHVWNFKCSEIKSDTYPIEIPPLKGAIQVATGTRHLIVLKEDGSVWTWGNIKSSLLGKDDLPEGDPPIRDVMLKELDGSCYVGCSSISSLVLKKDGSVWSWCNQDTSLGNGLSMCSKRPVKATIENIELVSLSFTHVIAADRQGVVWTWGSNVYGDLGIYPEDRGAIARLPIKLFELRDKIESKGEDK